jgi:hypothetical protein
MFRALIFGGVSAATVVFAFGNVFAQTQSGTPAQAKAMEERVIAELKDNASAAVEKFNRRDGEFRQGDLYVFCFNVENGVFTAHPDRGLLGTDIRRLWEMDGSPLGKRIFDAAYGTNDSTIVTVSYNFPKPGTTNPAPKESYVTKVGNQGCGVGYYK